MDALKYILVQFVVAMLCAGGVLGLLMGVGLLLKPERIRYLNQYFSRWFSADKVSEQLDRPRATERFIYRHHRLVGSSVFICALFILYVFLFPYNLRRVSAAIPAGYWVLADALMAILLVGCVLACAVGIIVALRPSMLREIEESANRWVETDGIVRFFNKITYSPDENVIARRKLMGTIIIVGSAYVLIKLVPLMLRGGWKF